MFLAYTYSKAYLKDEVNDDPGMLNVVHTVKKLSKKDCRIAQLKLTIQSDTGWLVHIQKVPTNVTTYTLRPRKEGHNYLGDLQNKIVVHNTNICPISIMNSDNLLDSMR
ncbi:hypothetical protein NPIL_425841 [Nephila pilipes]|uniref:Uncharacterized protein n=1 Tax=Nephila pilipes TaxID=299642 RepID=A0A8X6TZX8_NEPPI|nr:hypothetical protein NPIL_425841 [Nephila pilipes]